MVPENEIRYYVIHDTEKIVAFVDNFSNIPQCGYFYCSEDSAHGKYHTLC